MMRVWVCLMQCGCVGFVEPVGDCVGLLNGGGFFLGHDAICR
jgi:hypothetical protein